MKITSIIGKKFWKINIKNSIGIQRLIDYNDFDYDRNDSDVNSDQNESLSRNDLEMNNPRISVNLLIFIQ